MELRKIPTRNLTNNIVNRRLKEVCCSFCYGVFQFIQIISQTEFTCYKSQWIACSLGSQSRRTAQTGIDFNNSILFRLRIESKLNIALSHNTYMAGNTYSQFT